MDSYQTFINQMINSIGLIDSENNILSIYLGGSVARGDYVVGASDIDIYIVVKSIENADKIHSYIKNIAVYKLGELLSWCPDGVTVAFTTYNEIKNGTSWLGANSEYFSFQETGKLLYGKDLKQEIKKPTDNEIVLFSQKNIEQLKQIIDQDISNIDKNKYFIRGIFGTVFSAMFFYLCCNHIYIRGKEKNVFELQKLNYSFSNEANEILLLWNKFCTNQLNDTDINELINLTHDIVSKI